MRTNTKSFTIALVLTTVLAAPIFAREANMVLYYALLRGWMTLGTGETFIRLLSVLFGVLTVVSVFYVGQKLFSRTAGLIAAAMLDVNSFHIMYSQEIRSYSLLALITTLSILVLTEALETTVPMNSPTSRSGYEFVSPTRSAEFV